MWIIVISKIEADGATSLARSYHQRMDKAIGWRVSIIFLFSWGTWCTRETISRKRMLYVLDAFNRTWCVKGARDCSGVFQFVGYRYSTRRIARTNSRPERRVERDLHHKKTANYSQQCYKTNQNEHSSMLKMWGKKRKKKVRFLKDFSLFSSIMLTLIE